MSGEGGGHLETYADTPNVFQTLLSKSGVTSIEGPSMTQYTRAKTMHDIEALLSLTPAHSGPSITVENHPGEEQAAGLAQVEERGKVVENNNKNKDAA